MKIPIEINDLNCEQTKKCLELLIIELDNLAEQDFFGTEGWRHFIGFDE